MKRVVTAALAALMLAGCASKEPVWEREGALWIRDYKRYALEGERAYAQASWHKAVEAARRSADEAPLLKLNTIRAGIACALLEPLPDLPTEPGYTAFLRGDVATAKAVGFPDEYAGFAKAIALREADRAAEETRKVEASVSALIGAGACVAAGVENGALYEAVIARASYEGWAGALEVWLKRALVYYTHAGDEKAAEAIRRRLAVLKEH